MRSFGARVRNLPGSGSPGGDLRGQVRIFGTRVRDLPAQAALGAISAGRCGFSALGCGICRLRLPWRRSPRAGADFRRSGAEFAGSGCPGGVLGGQMRIFGARVRIHQAQAPLEAISAGRWGISALGCGIRQAQAALGAISAGRCGFSALGCGIRRLRLPWGRSPRAGADFRRSGADSPGSGSPGGDLRGQVRIFGARVRNSLSSGSTSSNPGGRRLNRQARKPSG